jgi:hypothetical protein
MEGMPGNNKDDDKSEKKTPSSPKSKKKFSKEEMARSIDNNNTVEAQRSRQFLIGAEHRNEAFGPDFVTDKEIAQREDESSRRKKKPEIEEQEAELHQKAENERNYNTHGTWRDGQKKDRNDRDR